MVFVFCATFSILYVSLQLNSVQACMQKRDQTKVVGGMDAPDGKYTYAVSIQNSISHKCTGSALTANYVLTAAHCCQSDPNYRVVQAGTHVLSSGGTFHNVEKFIVHPDYHGGGDYHFRNDICLVKLLQPLIFDENVTQTTLPDVDNDEVPNGGTVTVMGWGFTDVNASMIPDHLQYDDKYTVFSSDYCATTSNGFFDNFEGKLCVVGGQNRTVCAGDSGGPLVYNDIQIGVFSFYYPPCGTPSPDFYTKVSYYLDWIKSNVGDDADNIVYGCY